MKKYLKKINVFKRIIILEQNYRMKYRNYSVNIVSQCKMCRISCNKIKMNNKLMILEVSLMRYWQKMKSLRK